MSSMHPQNTNKRRPTLASSSIYHADRFSSAHAKTTWKSREKSAVCRVVPRFCQRFCAGQSPRFFTVLKRMQTPGTTPPFFAVSDNCCLVDTNRPKLFSFYLLSFLELFFGDSLCSCLFIYLFSITHEENKTTTTTTTTITTTKPLPFYLLRGRLVLNIRQH